MLTHDLLATADSLNLKIRASHLAGKDNIVADALSRGWKTYHNEWTLYQVWADYVFDLYGRPKIDLFATAKNARLPKFCSRHSHPQAWAVGALPLDWTGFSGYASPWNLIHRVLAKLGDSRASPILIAPFWTRQPWFPMLVQLLVDNLFRFPPKSNFLSQLRGRILYPGIKHLQFSAWPLSGETCKQKAFQEKLSGSPLMRGEIPLYTFMTPG